MLQECPREYSLHNIYNITRFSIIKKIIIIQNMIKKAINLTFVKTFILIA